MVGGVSAPKTQEKLSKRAAGSRRLAFRREHKAAIFCHVAAEAH